MKLFFIRLTLFLTIFFLLDRCFLVFKSKEGRPFIAVTYTKLRQARERLFSPAVDATLIIGSSHGQFGVNPEQLLGSVPGPVYNFAFGSGSPVPSQLEALKYYFAQGKKISRLLYTIESFSLNLDEVSWAVAALTSAETVLAGTRASSGAVGDIFSDWSLAALYGQNFRNYLNDVRNGEIRLPYFRREYLNDVLNGEANRPSARAKQMDLEPFSKFEGITLSPLGWTMGHGILDRNFVRYREMNFSPKPRAVESLQAILRLAKERGIEVTLIQVPEHVVALKSTDRHIHFNRWMTAFAAKNRIQYKNYDSKNQFPVERDDYFFDSDHLNEAGARYFSEKLAADLKRSSRRDVGSF